MNEKPKSYQEHASHASAALEVKLAEKLVELKRYIRGAWAGHARNPQLVMERREMKESNRAKN